MIKVLLVEDDTIVAKIILYYLEEEKLYEVKWAKTGGEALARARESFDVILMDVLLPDVNGIDLFYSDLFSGSSGRPSLNETQNRYVPPAFRHLVDLL